MAERVKRVAAELGLPRIIILGFFVLLVVAAGFFRMDLPQLFIDCLKRWGLFGILTLAMVPAVQCGIGLNFGITMGIVGGLLGGLIVIEFQWARLPVLMAIHPLLAQWVGILLAMAIGVGLSLGIGWLYGQLLNRVKGSEMTVTTYVGFSIIAFMNIMWTILPFRSGTLIYPNAGEGLRNTISLADSYSGIISNTFAIGWSLEPTFQIGFGADRNWQYVLPTGLLLFFFLMCFLVWLFMRSKTGIAMSAAGANPQFARASGINVNKMRLIGTVASTLLAAVGILVYAQGFGFMQLYNGPQMMGFNSVAAVLIGGATPRRARISHVLLGTLLFQSILSLALPVANMVIPEGNLSEVMRMIIANGIILYALSQTREGR